MQKRDVYSDSAKASMAGNPVLKRNTKGQIPNFWEWYEWVSEASQLHFPSSFKELTTSPMVETEAQIFSRMASDIPEIPLEDDKDDLLSDADYAQISTLSSPAAQARATSIAVRELQINIRARNAAHTTTNKYRSHMLRQRMDRHEALILERPKLAAWIVSDNIMPSYIHDEIKSDGKYISGLDGVVPAHIIMEIACRVLGGVSVHNTKQRLILDDELRALKQGSMPTHVYCSTFKRAHLKCVHAGTKMDVADIIACFVYGLNLQVYELYIKAFNADPMAVPDNLGAVMADALAYLQSAIEVNPSLSKVLDHSAKTIRGVFYR
jgi:hypothetical protein